MSSPSAATTRRASVSAIRPRPSRRSLRPAPIEGLVTGDDVNREFFELMSTSAPRRSTVGRALQGLMSAAVLDDARAHLDVLLRAAQAHTLREHPADAASALLALAALRRAAHDQAVADACTCAARQLAAPEAVEALLDAATRTGADLPALCDALDFAGADVVDDVVRRLNAAQDIATRRAYYDLALALGTRPEMHHGLTGRLVASLGDERWFVVRNALVLLAALKFGVPHQIAWTLIASPHRQIRLALAQITARQRPSGESLDLLLALLADPDAGVRFAAAVGLGRHSQPAARHALAGALAAEDDAETRRAITAALGTKSRGGTLQVA